MSENPSISPELPEVESVHVSSTSLGEDVPLRPAPMEIASEGVITPVQGVSLSALGLTDTRSVRARRWSRLSSIRVADFKAIKEATIPLGDVTILAGPNGSGKSSDLQAIHWAARAASYILPKNTKEMISFERLDYLPSSEPLRTAHRSERRSEITPRQPKSHSFTCLKVKNRPRPPSEDACYGQRKEASGSIEDDGQE